MDKLYAPWRDCYVQGHIKQNEPCEKTCCVFCAVFVDEVPKQERFLLYKGADFAIMLNLYPYNGGHVLIFPLQHVEQLYELPLHVQDALMRASCKSMKILKEVLKCDALNFGANIGKDGGAGIPDHVHLHAVPRWRGDTGFLPIINDTKLVSVNLESMFIQLKPVFDKEFNERNV